MNGENGADSRFVIRAYFVIRHSDFVILPSFSLSTATPAHRLHGALCRPSRRRECR